MAARPGHRKSHSTSALSTIASSNSSSSSGSASGSATSAISAAARRRNRASQHPALGRVEERDGPSRSGSRRDIAGEGREMEGSASMVELPGLSRSRSTRAVDPSSRRGSANETATASESENVSSSKRGAVAEGPDLREASVGQPSAGQDELEIRLAKALGERAKRQTEESRDKAGLHRTKSRKSVVREGNEDDVRIWTREVGAICRRRDRVTEEPSFCRYDRAIDGAERHSKA